MIAYLFYQVNIQSEVFADEFHEFLCREGEIFFLVPDEREVPRDDRFFERYRDDIIDRKSVGERRGKESDA